MGRWCKSENVLKSPLLRVRSGRTPTADFVFYHERAEDPRMRLAVQWTDETAEHIRSYANGIRTREVVHAPQGRDRRRARDRSRRQRLHGKGPAGPLEVRDGERGGGGRRGCVRIISPLSAPRA